MNVNDIYVFGDSWSSAVNSDTLRDREGWPQMLGIPEAAVQIMHSMQALVLITMEDVLKFVGCEILTPFYLLKGDDFSQGDIHPNTVGHRQIAEAIKERL